MSLVEPTLLSLARAAAIAGLTLVLLLAGGPGIRATNNDLRRFLFWGTMITLLVPGFVTGFVLSQKSGTLNTAMDREVNYVLLVWCRFAPLALFAVWLSPPSLSPEGIHVLRLRGVHFWRRFVWELRAWGRGLWLGVGLVFLLAFQEFELATTWNMRAWTVALFDAQVGGMELGATLRFALLPAGVQVVMCAALVLGLKRGEQTAHVRGEMASRATLGLLPAIVAWFVAITLSFVVISSGLFASAITMRYVDVLWSLVPLREVTSGILLSACGTTAAWLLAGWIARRRGWRFLLAFPGLLGALTCGLLVLALLQTPGLSVVRDSAFPAIAALGLVLLPFALLLRFGIALTSDPAALHIARETGARRALWLDSGWPRLSALLLLFCLGYGDFTINALLAPPEFASAGVRILNLLHYGRSDALTVMFALAFAIPLSCVALTALAARFYPRRRVR